MHETPMSLLLNIHNIYYFCWADILLEIEKYTQVYGDVIN